MIDVLSEAVNKVSTGNFDYTIPYDSDEKINKFVESFNSMIQALKKRIEDLVILKEKYHNLYDQSLDMCRIVNADNVILECNKAYAGALGYTKEEIFGKNIFEHDSEDSIPVHLEIIESWKKHGKVLNREIWFKRKDGSTFPVLLSSNGIFDRNGKLVASNTIIRDITDIYDARKKIEENEALIRKQYEELKQMEQLKDEFASMITHELKTPFVPIKGNCEMLRKPGMLGEMNADQLEAVESIFRNAERLERLIGDVLDVQKLALGKMTFNKEEFRVDEFMTMVYKDFSPMMPDKQIEFVNSTKETYIIKTDKNRLFQVFRNLIGNAVDFVPQHGKIEINTQKDGNDILFKIIDSGIGIPKEKQADLFKKFYQVDTSAKRKHGGTGLGLSICKGIVEGLDGRIWLESEVGKGTTFFVSLPINDQ